MSTDKYALGALVVGVALLALGRVLRVGSIHCGDETCEEAHP